MPKYLISYESIEYYQKEYEAASYEDAQALFESDDKLWESTPMGSSVELLEIEESI